MKKEMTYTELAKETALLTAADYRRSRILFSGAEPRIRQQYLRSRNRAVQLYTAAAVRDHDDLKCCAFNYRIFYLRKGIWREDGLHQCGAAGISGNF